MQSEQLELPFEDNSYHELCPYGNKAHVEDEEGCIYCDACWDAKMPEWKGYDNELVEV